jgi:hypothetical protein
VQSITDVNALKRGITRVFPRPGSGAYMLDGILDISKGFQKRKAERPAIIGITMDAVEFSNLHWEQVLKTLDSSGATLHMLSIGSPSSSLADEENPESAHRQRIAGPGGRQDRAGDVRDPEALSVADDCSISVVTHGRRSPIPPEASGHVKQSPDNVRARTQVAGQ